MTTLVVLLHMQARAHGRAQRPAEPVPLLASCAVLGCTYGIGIGLYFKTLQWLQWMFAGLALVSVGASRASGGANHAVIVRLGAELMGD